MKRIETLFREILILFILLSVLSELEKASPTNFLGLNIGSLIVGVFIGFAILIFARNS